MIRFSFPGVALVFGLALAALELGARPVLAQPGQDGYGAPNGGPPVYQWRSTDGHRHDDRRDRREFRRDMRYQSPQISAGSFQRPYPYHLDYYKMRYGGSYAPYFGNLYGTPFGTPQVANYPPYYGPYYTGNGGGTENGYAQPGYGGAPGQYPGGAGAMTPGTEVEESTPAPAQARGTVVQPSGEALPTP